MGHIPRGYTARTTRFHCGTAGHLINRNAPPAPSDSVSLGEPRGGAAVFLAEYSGTEWTSFLVVPCTPPPPPPPGDGGGGGHGGFEDGGLVYPGPTDDGAGRTTIRLQSASVLRHATPLQLSITSSTGEPIQLDILDVSGRKIESRRSIFGPGTSSLTWAHDRTPPGIYLIRIRAREFERTLRIAILP